MAKLSWRCGGQSGECPAEAGATLMDALRAARAPLDFPCGGKGRCGKCRVAASGALSVPEEEERRLLEGAPEGTRLACLARVLGDCRAELPGAERMRIAENFTAGNEPLRPLYAGAYGAAFDIGTTTVVGYLFARERREPLAVLGETNRQGRCGADVLSRIEYAASHSPDTLRELICGQLADMLRALCARASVAPEAVGGLCVTGNTTMLHLAAGLDPYPLSQAPFRPASLFGGTERLRLPGFEGLEAYLPRCISAYVGADITCSILASGIMRDRGNLLLVDAGTNGEMALRTDGRLLCCATAAGPAFEGAGISCGSGAVDGAVSAVRLRGGAYECGVIGGGPARTICGSGLIDAMACALRAGASDWRGRVRRGVIPIDGPVSLTQRDVRELQLAKGAVRAGMDTLVEAAGLTYGEIDRLVFCGGFGSFLHPDTAAEIGLIPAELCGRTVALGNAAGTGAGRILQSRSLIAEADGIAGTARVVELSTSKSFQTRYIRSMNFPRPE